MLRPTSIVFHGTTLFAYPKDDEVFIALKSIVAAIGLDWNGQYQRIRRDPILSEGTCLTHIPSPGGIQETFCLALCLLNGWLFGIDSRRVKDPTIRARVQLYQRECYDVLADHFLGARRAAAEPFGDAAAPAADLGLREREHKLELVNTMHRLKGAAHALALYRAYGFPVEEPAPADMPPADMPPASPLEPLAAAIVAFARRRRRWKGTPTDLLSALGHGRPETAPDWPATAQGLGTALRRFGPALAQHGVRVHRRHSGQRFYTIEA